jgi:exo-1,4-beta-D-glucosaminidase
VRRFLAVLILCSCTAYASPKPGSLPLKSGWLLQSSCQVEATGETISTEKFHPQHWYAATVPGGVVANLVADKVYPEPYSGMKLREIPGTTYPIGKIFTNLPMPDDSPFKCSWWYRTEFHVSAQNGTQRKWLHFDGINYRANIWLNGKQIANAGDIAGTWRAFEFDVTDALVRGPNVLAVEVFAPTETDLALNWVDWSPAPPDKNMGLWRDVWLGYSGPVTVRNTQVISDLEVPELESARLTVTTELRNASPHPVTGVVRLAIENIRLTQPVVIAAGETQTVTFSPEQYPQLVLDKPRVWWPAPLGPQNLYRARVTFARTFTPVAILPTHRAEITEERGRFGPSGRTSTGPLLPYKAAATESDSETVTFGIRKVTGELNDKGYRQFTINGRNILIRGAGWAPDMLLNESDERKDEELRYVRQMNLNTVRLEGKIETDHFFETADRMGILVMPGWCCCSIWEQWAKWTPETHAIANASLRTQILRLRNHPSVFVWLNGSDMPPSPDVESDYLQIEKDLNWPNPVISSASAEPTDITGASGVKMTGPYEYVPPNYWLADVDKHGGAWGYNTETSPGPAPPPVEDIRQMVGLGHLWPIDDVWSFHCGLGKFRTLDVFTAAMNGRYGEAQSVEEYALKSQAMTYEGERAMFEAYGRNKYTSTGVIQWMLNNSWPSMIWHLFDWYMTPGGGFFGARKANEPLHVQYSYDDGSVMVVNSLYQAFTGLRVSATVYNLDMTPKFTQSNTVDVAEDGVARALTIPAAIDGLSTTYFLNLELHDAGGKLLSSNFYWLSTQPDVLDWAKTIYYVTPQTQYADLKGLNDLPKVKLAATAHTHSERGERVMTVTLRNPSKSLAFLVRLRLLDHQGRDVLPVLWDDNFVSLLPGETREIAARVEERQFSGAPTVRIEGWNVGEENVEVK